MKRIKNEKLKIKKNAAKSRRDDNMNNPVQV